MPTRKTIRRRLLPAQTRFVRSRAPELMFSGAFGAGKTRALCDKIVMLSLTQPRNRGLLCRKTEVSVRATTLRTLLDGDGALPPALPSGLIRRHSRADRTITLINGSEIIYGGMFGEGRAWINSLNLGWVAVDQAEELSQDDWQMLQGRLRLDAVPLRQIFGACNPRHPGHWIHRRFFIERPPGTEVVSANTFDNPHLPADYVARLRRFTGAFYDRFVLGRWVGVEGLVYDNFDPLVHVVERFALRPEWRRWRAIDFGYINPFVCLWACELGAEAPLPEGALVIYREIYQSRRRVAELGAQIARLSQGERFIATFADHAAADRAELAAQGVPTTAAYKEITPGLQAVRAALGNEQDAPPRLYFFRDAAAEHDARLSIDPVSGARRYVPTCTAEEFNFYRWPAASDAAAAEHPVKRHDHGMDALRYLVMGVARGSNAFVDAQTGQRSRWRRRF